MSEKRIIFRTLSSERILLIKFFTVIIIVVIVACYFLSFCLCVYFPEKRSQMATCIFLRLPRIRTRRKYTRPLTNVPWKTQWGESSRGNPGLKPVRIFCVNI